MKPDATRNATNHTFKRTYPTLHYPRTNHGVFVLGLSENACARTNLAVFVLRLSENACPRTNHGVCVLGLSLRRVRKHCVYDIFIQFEDISDLTIRGVVFLMHLSGHLYPFFGSQLRRILHTIHPDT